MVLQSQALVARRRAPGALATILREVVTAPVKPEAGGSLRFRGGMVAREN